MSERRPVQLGLEPDSPAPTNLRRYPLPVEAETNAELRELLRRERDDEPPFEAWEDRYAYEVGVPRWGEL